ncbi:MAG: thioredoxin [Candidatus Cloacimonetes bacterium]|nr:thioredoxin [Candidatus Cloacimonadota bacterium]
MKITLMLLILTLLLVSACDRFDHDVYNDANLEASFGQFNLSLSAASLDSLDGVMNWYSEDYLNDNDTKSDIEHEYMSYFLEYGPDLMLSAKNMEYWKTNRIVFKIWITLPDTSFAIAEKEDFLIETDGNFIFYGDQIDPPPLNPEFPVVIMQYFTSTTCGSCPLVAEKLEEMLNTYGGQLVVLEYISNQDPGSVYMPEALYYNAGEQPTSIVQGEYPIIGSEAAALSAYKSRYEQALADTMVFRFTSLDLTISGNTVTGSVNWEELLEFSGENLQLRAVLLEEEPDLHYSTAPSVYFENRVLGAAELDYDETASSAAISVVSNIELPEKISLVVWLQDRVENASISGAHIYNVIKKMGGE